MKNEKTVPAQLRGLDTYSKLLDSKFRVPGTNIRFGADFIIGLVPFAGDILSFLFSSGLVLTMARHGVSGQVIGKMLWNVALDTVIGSVPFFGDIFDLFSFLFFSCHGICQRTNFHIEHRASSPVLATRNLYS